MKISDQTDSGAFTALEIEQANARHDRDYGWSREWPSLYTNRFRLTESVIGDPFEERPVFNEAINCPVRSSPPTAYSGHYVP
jgi:hypothetical protein